MVNIVHEANAVTSRDMSAQKAAKDLEYAVGGLLAGLRRTHPGYTVTGLSHSVIYIPSIVLEHAGQFLASAVVTISYDEDVRSGNTIRAAQQPAPAPVRPPVPDFFSLNIPKDIASPKPPQS